MPVPIGAASDTPYFHKYILIYLSAPVIPSMHTGGISHMTFQRLRVSTTKKSCVNNYTALFALRSDLQEDKVERTFNLGQLYYNTS